jgi:2-polyprenyl-3-methyl-5-hydroxy-6-metoxy-1,4-benzoquinol methylase
MTIDTVLQEQIAYYRARAGEYDQWFLRLGRYDRGEQLNQDWFSQVGDLRAWLAKQAPLGDTLELACGTGWWSEQLVQYASRLTAVDASPEVIELNKERLGDQTVNYLQADLFSWQSEEQYDSIFFSYWLSHVPHERFDDFWRRVAAMLKPDGRILLIDSLRTPLSTAVNHELQAPEDPIQVRKLNDGQSFNIVKIYYTPEELSERLAALGLRAELERTEEYFLYGTIFLA